MAKNTKVQFTKLIFFLLCSTVLISCEAIGYYSQAAQGQISIFLGRQNIEELISSDNFPDDLKQKFKEIEKIKTAKEKALAKVKKTVRMVRRLKSSLEKV